jgi:uncharacterized protein YifE (UPF0438 family)
MVEDYGKYKVQRNLVKEKVIKAKQQAWEDFGTKMEEDYQGNQKLFYRVIRNMRKEREKPIKFIKDKSGNLLTTEREILERWGQYLQELYRGEEEITVRTRAGKNRKGSSEQLEDHSQENTTEITKEGIENAIKKMKMGRAAGHDGITPEQIKYMENYGKEHMHKLLNLVWKKKCLP